MSPTRSVSRVVLAVLWLVVGAGMVAAPVWVGYTRWQPVLNGHPLTLVLGLLSALLGLVAVATAIAVLASAARGGDTKRPVSGRGARWRIALGVPALVVCALVAGTLAWARPFPAAPDAVAALRSSDTVRYSDRLTWYELLPVRKDKDGNVVQPTTGIVFEPGARVDARAYAHLLRPLAERGFLVAVLKEPLGVSLTAPSQAGEPIAAHPQVTHWAVGGHSLGGVTAASYADENRRVAGLVLYAAYPRSRMQRTDLKVLSVSGGQDGVSTPAEVAARKPDLPAHTSYVIVKGGTHSFFGDYGDQPGDGTATIPRATAQHEILTATVAFLTSLTPVPKRK